MANSLARATLVFFLVLTGYSKTYAAEGDAPPKAAIREVSDQYFGTTIVDPYRWMEDAKNPEFTSWLKGQAAYAAARMEQLPLRADLLKRLEALSDSNVQVSGVRRVGASYFYYKLSPGDNDRKLYVRHTLTGVERLLVDPRKLFSDGKRYSIMAYSPSQDGRYLSYIVSMGGSEVGELRVLEVASGRDLGERIDRTRWSAGSWLPDGRSFVYWRQRKLDGDAPLTEALQRSRVYLHVLGSDPDQDKPVHGYGVHPDVTVEPALFPWVWVPYGSKYALAVLDTGVSPNYAYYIAPVDALKQPIVPWRKIVDFSDDIRSIVVQDDELYLLSYKNTPRFRVLRVDAKNPDLASAREVVPAGQAVITGIAAARDALYVQLLDGGIGRLLRVDYKDHSRSEIKLPYNGAIFDWATDSREAGVLVGLHSWVKPPGYFVLASSHSALTETVLQPRSAIAVSAFESVDVAARSHDGAMIPLSIVYKRGLKRDGGNPALLLGYGAYGFPLQPSFNARSLAWLERGGVLAFAHVRGGGEYGRDWHTAGQKATKPNTWKDFIACAEFLIAENYTSPPRLAGQGRSAGGILIGNAIAERPELFAAAVINVGVMNPLRFETTPNGPPNIPEFGSVKTEAGFKALLAMDAYTKIADRTAYPAVLLTHGINDPRVEPWLSAKMAARLQAATASERPVWLRIEYDAGHGLGTSKNQYNAELADTYAFLFDQLRTPNAKAQKIKRAP
jgi:prolyl oligopeptidase